MFLRRTEEATVNCPDAIERSPPLGIVKARYAAFVCHVRHFVHITAILVKTVLDGAAVTRLQCVSKTGKETIYSSQVRFHLLQIKPLLLMILLKPKCR